MKLFALACALSLAGCKKEAAPAAGVTGKAAPAEVEMLIDVRGANGEAYVYASPEPCDSPTSASKKWGEAVPVRKDAKTFLEIFVPQHSKGYVCGVAVDAQKRVVAAGGDPRNPFTLEGEGEVRRQPEIDLKPLPEPRPAPEGLLRAK
jgi:hypothetical protein